MHRGKLLATGSPDQLRRLAPGLVLQLLTSEPKEALLVLRERLKAKSVTPFGQLIHVLISEPKSTSRRVEAILADAGIQIRDVRLVKPSLQDDFVSLIQRRG